MQKIVVDGLFVTQRITGTQRYAHELMLELDLLVPPGSVEILVPESAQKLPSYRNIRVVKYGKRTGIPWQQIDLPWYLRKKRARGVFLNNVLPLTYRKGIIAVHDICYKVHPEFYRSLHDKLSALWHRVNYWFAAHSDMTILTVSFFSKDEIMKHYSVDPSRFHVIYPSWQHIGRIGYSTDLYERYPMLSPKNFLFALSSLGANKNFVWVLQEAKRNPDQFFAIAGGGKLKGVTRDLGLLDLPNVQFLGYVSDEDVRTLMRDCKAFLFPSLYEGFGLPPLEALAEGANIVISDQASLPEIYGSCAYYIDPLNYDIDLDALLKKPVASRKEVLEKYDWAIGAKKLFGLLFSE